MVGLLSFTGTGSDPWSSLDGRLNAPTGTPQAASILNLYPSASPPNARVRWPTLTGTQPPWEAAGVDYAVGPRPSVTLKDPFQGLTPSTAHLDPALLAIGADANTHANGDLIQFSGSSANNATLSGWDFSGALNNGGANGGYGILLGGNNMTVTDCVFRMELVRRITGFVALNVTGLTIQYCIFDGAKLCPSAVENSFVQNAFTADGDVLIQYNLFQGAYLQHLELGPHTSTNNMNSLTIRYNLFKAAGYSAPVIACTGAISGGTTFTVSAASPNFSGAQITPGMRLFTQSGTGLTAESPIIISGISGTGGNGTYLIAPSQSNVTAQNMSVGGFDGYNIGGHGDTVFTDFNTTSSIIKTVTFSYNTVWQSELDNVARMRGFAFSANGGANGLMNSFGGNNNTFIVPASHNISWDFSVGTSWLNNNGVATLSQNYIDQTGNVANSFYWYKANEGQLGPWSGTFSIQTNNINMPDGTTLT